MATKSLDQRIVQTPGVCGGKPRIDGHRITVQNVAIWHERLGRSADEIARAVAEGLRRPRLLLRSSRGDRCLDSRGSCFHRRDAAQDAFEAPAEAGGRRIDGCDSLLLR